MLAFTFLAFFIAVVETTGSRAVRAESSLAAEQHRADTLKRVHRPGMKVEFVYCNVLFPHVRDIGGQSLMMEPLFSGNVALPNDEDTKKCVERGWLKVISEPFMAEPAYDAPLRSSSHGKESTPN